jgi:hypothetical protein
MTGPGMGSDVDQIGSVSGRRYGSSCSRPERGVL